MNIETLNECVDTFTKEVINSGFKRDLDDYTTSIPASASNIVTLRDIAQKVFTALDKIYNSDLPESLRVLLPEGKVKPFTTDPHNTSVRSLIENKQMGQQDFFNQLTQFINQLRKQVQQNISEIDIIKQFVSPYLSKGIKSITQKNAAIIAIIFNEKNTITNLGQFTKTIEAWNRILPIYHQLLKSESPRDIQIVEIQNGSIDVIVNLNFDVALNLVELFKVGFKVFSAYLSYKVLIKPIIESYHGNKKLIEQEKEREKLLLENIGIAVLHQIEEQHKIAKKTDQAINSTSVPKKMEEVKKLITSHIVKGNDVRLLSLPEKAGETKEEIGKLQSMKESLREQSIEVRRQLRLIAPEIQQKLLETYGKIEESDTSSSDNQQRA